MRNTLKFLLNFSSQSKSGIIVLKLKDQTIGSVNRALEVLLRTESLNKKLLENSLVIFDGTKIRIRKK